jgi:hypothetical protein
VSHLILRVEWNYGVNSREERSWMWEGMGGGEESAVACGSGFTQVPRWEILALTACGDRGQMFPGMDEPRRTG